MKILLLADYPAGYEITNYLTQRKEEIVGVFLPKAGTRNYLNIGYPEKILNTLNLSKDRVFLGKDINNQKVLSKIKKIKPDLILSIFWSFLLKPEFIAIPRMGCINLHLSYLPYNRGRNPNVWPIIDKTIAGVTLHYIDNHADTGDIIAQAKVAVNSTDTGKTLYKNLVKKSIWLFKETWPKIKNGDVVRRRQKIKYPAHTTKDLEKIDRIFLNKSYIAEDLINILRARTFPPFPSAYFINKSGKKVYVRIQLTEEI